MGRLEGKMAVVTGGAQGMGLATVKLFAEQGATVVLADILDEKGAAAAAKLGTRVAYHRLDVSSEAGWEQMVASIIKEHGAIDILVNNAAIVFVANIEDTKNDDFHRLLDINLIGPYLGMKAVIPGMKKRRSGSIINISSVSGLTAICANGAYCASKWGLRGLTRCAAMELGPFGVRVNSVHPGAVNTPMTNPEGKSFDQINTDLKDPFAGVAMSRMAHPEEIAQASLFLASDEASYVSGAELAVDGAWMCGRYLEPKPTP